MNYYRHRFATLCPNNGISVTYHLEIASPTVIMAEAIVSACKVEQSFHEKLADELHRKFGGYQTLRAHHHGVYIETRRG